MLRYRDLNSNQRKTLRAIRREARKLPAELRGVLTEAAVQTVLVEANAEHVSHGDRDSVGAFQQRPSQGWGPAGETVTRDTRQFFAAAKKMYRRGMTAGELAADVQRPAEQYRGRYAQRAQDARTLLKTTPLGTAAGGRRSAPAAATATPGGLQLPAVDTTYERLNAVKMFQQGRAGPLDFVLALRDIDAANDEQALQAALTPADLGEAPRRRSGATPTRPARRGDKVQLLELFWQGPGGINVKDGRRVPQGFVDGHDKHVHAAAATEKQVLQLAKIAQQMGLTVGEHPKFGGVGGGHVENSNHYARRAIDVTGTPAQLRKYARRVAALRK